jgi:hypothetical protein
MPRISKVSSDMYQEDALKNFEFELLIGALRYYEYRQTIASATFPASVIKRYWVKAKRTKKNIEFCQRVAFQFAEVDHKNGEIDWADLPDCDRMAWTLFYEFCKCYVTGYYSVECKDDKGITTIFKAFKNEYDGHYYAVDSYLENPYFPIYIVSDKIIEAKKPIFDVIEKF